MPIRDVSVPAASAEQVPEPIRQGMTALRDSLGVPADFAPEVSAAAAADVARGPLDSAPDADELGITARVDHTDLPFVTIDPIGSMDLDQAMFIESRDDDTKGLKTHTVTTRLIEQVSGLADNLGFRFQYRYGETIGSITSNASK